MHVSDKTQPFVNVQCTMLPKWSITVKIETITSFNGHSNIEFASFF